MKQRTNRSASANRGRKVGRRTLCTAETMKALCEHLSDACTVKTACEACGVSVTSFHEWVRRGEAGEQPFAQFATSVMRARGKGKAALVRSILEHPDWRGKLELLARVYPEEYARTAERPVPRSSVDDEGKVLGVAVIVNTEDGKPYKLPNFPVVKQADLQQERNGDGDQIDDGGDETGSLDCS